MARPPRQGADSKRPAGHIAPDQGKDRAQKPKFVLQFECMGRGKVVFREQEKADLIRSLQEHVGKDCPFGSAYTRMARSGRSPATIAYTISRLW